ncbi:MAG: UPF0182 family protein [Firmicutes bacterium]|nr:UPF0182 family protein [Bacillota bacterium]
MKKKKHIGFRAVLVIILLIIVGAIALDDLITDIIWYREMGYLSVFLTELRVKFMLGVPMFVVVMLVSMLMLKALKASFLKKSGMELPDKESKKRVRVIGTVLSGAFSLFLTLMTISTLWFEILQYLNSVDFGIDDPLFSKDISFYIFKLDFLDGLASNAIAIIVSIAIMITLYYIFLAGFSKSPQVEVYEDAESAREAGEDDGVDDLNDRLKKMFGAHVDIPGAGARKAARGKGKALLDVASKEIIILGVLFFLGIAATFYLRQFSLLYGPGGVSYGAGFADVTVTLNVYRAMIALSIAAAIALVIAIKKRSIKLGLLFPALMIIVSIVSQGAAAAVQNLVVSPDELNKESPYIANTIKYTRLAYNLQDIRVEDFTAEGDIDKTDVLNNMETFSNIRINDFDPAEQFYNQTQSIRSYYKFNDVDVDRYYVNDEYTQVFLSAREIDQDRVDDTWLIKHLKYTHGYGITLSRVDKITASGQPDMLISGIPPISEVPEIRVSRPEIYYGESTDTYVITNTGESEFDYPSGETNVYCSYDGTGGIRLTPLNRALFALKERNLKMLISTNIGSDSRIHIYRNIVTRIKKIAPFLALNDDPYVVVEDGKIYWIVDAYTYSTKYPYSEPYDSREGVNYLRNSVKIVVDAYNGDVNFYISDETDPIVQSLRKIYPSLLKDLDQMPAALRNHLQYPNMLFNIQAYVYTRYHMTNVEVFYQSEDLWSIASEQYGQSTKQMEPNYFIMKLPGEDSAEFVSTIPYTPSGKANLTGILIARQDGEDYGQLVLYRMPKYRTIYGPSQVEAQINQDAEISKEFSLWNNSGSSYLRGNMFVIPVEDELLYVEPIYLEASTGSLPEVKRVVMYYGDQLAYEPTLAECLDKLFGAGAGDPLKTAKPIITGHQMAEELARAAEEAANQPQQPEQGEQPEVSPGVQPLPVDTDGADISELAALANEAYENALKAMSEGDFVSYAQYIELMAKYVQQMVR